MYRRRSSYAVAVTGGSGCLGQHLVKLLQTNADHVSEIRVIDKILYENQLGHKKTKPVTSVCSDITNLADLRRTFKGVRTVFHLCSLVSVSNFPDTEGMEKVNVKGTEEVIKACVLESVEHLIYCSTVDFFVGNKDIIEGTEETTTISIKVNDKCYGGSKLKAESMVLKANGRQLNSGGRLKTLSLRPTGFYGELDRNYITRMLRYTKLTWGVQIRIGLKKKLFQHSYAGNVAWAFICADKALGNDAGGEAYFITDDSPVDNMYPLFEPFLKLRGFKLSTFPVPFWLTYTFVLLLEIFLWIISPLKKVDLGLSAKCFEFVKIHFVFSSDKARSHFQYEPLFSPEEGLTKACAYYNSLSI